MFKIAFLTIFTFFGMFGITQAEVVNDAPIVYVFGDEECQPCRDEVKLLFDEGYEYKFLNISEDEAAKVLYNSLLRKHELAPIIPLTIIGSEVVVGYEKEQTTGREINRAFIKAKKSNLRTVEEHLNQAPKLEIKEAEACQGLDCDTTNIQAMAQVPFLGLVNLRDTSLIVVALILGLLTIPKLLSIGWLFVTSGAILLFPRRFYAAAAGFSFLLVELVYFFYFFNSGYRSTSRFVLEGMYAGVLAETFGLLIREWHVVLYGAVALIDNSLVIFILLFLFPWLQKFDERQPGSQSTLALTLLFIGGVCMTYFIMFP